MPRKRKATVPHNQDDRPVVTLESLYAELNRELFGGRLHPVEEVQFELKSPEQMNTSLGNIHLKWGTHPGGGYRPLRGSVRINIRAGMTTRQTRKTMAHEMAHLAAAMEDGTLRHNGTFWKVMASIGYGKHHHFTDEKAEERDLYTEKSEERKAVWFWRKQPIGMLVQCDGFRGNIWLAGVQPRGTKVRITDGRGHFCWVAASSMVKPA